MSLYNMLFGQHSNAADLLKFLGVTEDLIPRYRSVYWDGEYIVIHTRTGGGNRDYYDNKETCKSNYPEFFSEEAVAQYGEPAGPWNDDLRSLPGFSHDEDDDFDSTYANFYYNPPSEAVEMLKSLPADIPPEQQWEALFAALDATKDRNR